MDSSKKTADNRGVGVKNCEKFADHLNGWSPTAKKITVCKQTDIQYRKV